MDKLADILSSCTRDSSVGRSEPVTWTGVPVAIANSAQRAPQAQVSARLHEHIYHPRSYTRGRLDLFRSRQETPTHAIELKNIFLSPLLCYLLFQVRMRI